MKKTISEFLNDEYKKYAIYVLENRSIPSIIDGLKPTARKALYVGLKHIRNKTEKVSTLAGKVISEAQYHNGNVSAENVIITMSQLFKNNLPLFDGIGQFGTLKDPYPSASRYISVKLNKTYDKTFKDDDLLISNVVDGISCEPIYYYPIIPMVLINQSSGVAVAFATNILNRLPKDVIQSCLDFLNNKKVKNPKPYINEFTGNIINDKENSKRWIISGIYEKINSNTISITEIPPSMTYQKYEELLDKLVKNEDIIEYYNTGQGSINYIIKFSRERLKKLTDDGINKLFKLIEYETENFNVLDEFGKLKTFDSVEEIIKYFVEFRLKLYTKRKDFQIKKINDQINILDNKIRFIKSIIDELLIVNNRKKDMIEKDLVVLKFDKVENNFDYLLRMPIYSLTKETYDRLREDMNVKKQELVDVKKSKPIDTYIKELEDLKKII